MEANRVQDGGEVLDRREIGRRGEEIAAAFLKRNGLDIAERNFHCRWGEVDLVAVFMPEVDEAAQFWDEEAEEQIRKGRSNENRGTVRFVEVKTRTGMNYGTPGEAVTYAKQQKIKKTALTWLQKQEQYFPCICFDVIEVWVIDNTAKIRWLKNCF